MTATAIALDARIYKQAAVNAAVREYKQLARVSVESHAGTLLITFKDYPQEYKDTIAHEFCNYVLWKLGN